MESVLPINYRVLVKNIVEEKKVGEIMLSSASENADRVDVGEIARDIEIPENAYMSILGFSFHKGQRVLFETTSLRQKVSHEGEDCFLIHAKHIIGIVSE